MTSYEIENDNCIMYYYIAINNTVPSPDRGNRVAVGRSRTWRDCDRDREKSALGFNAVLPN